MSTPRNTCLTSRDSVRRPTLERTMNKHIYHFSEGTWTYSKIGVVCVNIRSKAVIVSEEQV